MVGEMTENDKEVYQKGVALLEEWEDVNYCEHDFKFKDEWLTDKEVVDLLDEQHEKLNVKQEHITHLENKIHRMRKEINKLKELYHYRSADIKRENEKLKQQLNDITFNCTQNRIEFDKDKLYVKDTHTEIILKNRNLHIVVFIPQIKGYYRFNYVVTGRRLETLFPKGVDGE